MSVGEVPSGPPLPPALSPEQAKALAERHGLRQLGVRPPFFTYLKDIWRRRSFIWTLASSERAVRNAEDRLGVLWTIINPVLLVVTYFLIFGLLVGTREGIGNFIGYLAAGVLIFGFSSSAMTRGSKAIVGNVSLVRGLRFPRAVLPLSITLTELLALMPAVGVLLVVMVITKEPITWSWLLVPVALAIQTVILAGLVLTGAWLLNISRDIGNLIPVLVRLLRYVSGVFFSIAEQMKDHPVIRECLELQPFALPIALVRQSLMKEQPLVLTDWLVAAGWAVVLLSAGMWLFWRDEAKYGRG